MNKKELIKIIELVVRKEVKKQVNEIFIKENKSSLKSLTEKEFKEPIRQQYKKKEKVHYTSNEALNNVLNETVGGIEGNSKQGTEEWPSLGGGTFDSSNVQDVLGYGDMAPQETKLNHLAAKTLAEAGSSPEQVGDGVMNALTRNYSDVMKAIEKKKGSRRG
jgi:hypothetical protein